MITKTHCMQKLTRLKDQDTPSLNGWETFFELGQNTCNYVWLIIIGSLPQNNNNNNNNYYYYYNWFSRTIN